MRRLVLGLCLGAGTLLVAASSSVYTTYGTGNGTAPAFVQLCPKSDGTQNAVPCPTSGTGGGTVTQGAGSASNPWWMQGLGTAGSPAGGVLSVQGVSGGTTLPTADTQLDALISGGALLVQPQGTQTITGSLSITSIGSTPVTTSLPTTNVTTSAPPINVAPVTIATTGTAVQFGAHTLLQGVSICGQHVSGTSAVNNTGTVWVGSSSVTQGTGAPIQPGACINYTDNQSSDFWVNGASGDGATMRAN